MAKQTWVGSDRVKPVLLEKIPSNTDEFYAHKIATTGEHGIASTIVGTDETQTLTNKTLTNPIVNGVHVVGDLVETGTTQTLTNKTLTNPIVNGVHVVGVLVETGTTQTLTNKSLSALDNTITDFRHGVEVDNATTNVHGTTGQVVGTDNTQTLTNKTLVNPIIDGLTITGPMDITGPITTDLDMNNKYINSLADPVVANQATNKHYVDQLAFNSALPDMAGNAYKILGTDGIDANWLWSAPHPLFLTGAI